MPPKAILMPGLPSELLLMVAKGLSARDLLALMLTSRQFFHLGAPVLAPHAARCPFFKTAALYWAAITKNKPFLKTLLETGTSVQLVERIPDVGAPLVPDADPDAGYDTDYEDAQFVYHTAPSPCPDVVLNDALARGAGLLVASILSPLGLPALFWAIEFNHFSLLRLVLRSGTNPNTPNHLSQSALHVALELDNAAMALTLLAYGAALDAADTNGVRPLVYAVRSCPAMVSQLLQRGADPNHRDRCESTALHCAVDVAAVSALLQHGADPNLADEHGSTPLHYAAGQRHMADAVMVLLSWGADVTAVNKAGVTPVGMAERSGNRAVGPLLQGLYRAVPGARFEGGRTYLHVAVRYSLRGFVEMLLGDGADVGARDGAGETPLHVAAGNADCGVAVALVGWGAVVDAADGKGRTALHVAAGIKGLALFWELVVRGGRLSFTVKDGTGCTPLHLAAQTLADPGRRFGKCIGVERDELWREIGQMESALLGEVLRRWEGR